MVLLTQSQVGVALSSLVIFLCTSALFLSGYVLQQKTVSDIRRAIKPQVAPLSADITLPPQYREKDLWDGKESANVEHVEIKPSGGARGDDDSMVGATRWQKAKKLKEKKEAEEKSKATMGKGKGEKQAEAIKKPKRNLWGRKIEAKAEKEVPLSDAARRKKIKDQILAEGQGENAPQGYRRKWM